MEILAGEQASSHERGLDSATGDHIGLVRHATLAASSHNTQPWKFKLARSSITILPDFTRRCPAVDADDHHLFASLGCAAENLLLAAEAAGLRGHSTFDASHAAVDVELEAAPARVSELYGAIAERQCSRSDYDGRPLDQEQLRQLEEAGRGDGVSIVLLSDSRKKEEIAEYVTAGNTAQFADAAWAKEMRQWVRFNARAARATGDGLYGAVMGMPDIPTSLGKLVMPFAVSAKRQNEKDVRHIRSSSVIVVLFSEADDSRHWVEAGRCYERLALRATTLGLKTAFINQPVEVPALRRQFAAHLGIGERRPDLVVRIGHGPDMPRSLRRPVEAVIV